MEEVNELVRVLLTGGQRRIVGKEYFEQRLKRGVGSILVGGIFRIFDWDASMRRMVMNE